MTTALTVAAAGAGLTLPRLRAAILAHDVPSGRPLRRVCPHRRRDLIATRRVAAGTALAAGPAMLRGGMVAAVRQPAVNG